MTKTVAAEATGTGAVAPLAPCACTGPRDQVAADGDQIAELAQQLAAVACQLARIASPSGGRRLARVDHDAMARLLPAMRARCGSYVFSGRELIAHAAIDGHGDLREAIEQATGRPLDCAGRSLGKLFARAVDAAVDGLRLERVGDCRDGALWVCATDKAAETRQRHPAHGQR